MTPKTDDHLRHFSAFRSFSTLLLSLWVAACATSTDRHHPEFSTRIAPIKVLCILPADIIVYEEMPDGRLILRRDWSRLAHREVRKKLVDELTARKYQVLTISENERSLCPDLQEVLTLYRAVNKSIQLHTFGPDIFPVKKAQFDFSVGSLSALRDRYDADAFLFARILFKSSDRQAKAYASLGLADGSGTIIWYGADGQTQPVEKKRFGRTLAIVEEILAEFPEGRL